MPSTRGRSGTDEPQRRLPDRNPIIAIIVCIALIGAIVFVGVLWFRHRASSASVATAAPPHRAALPPPAPPVCNDDALTQMAPRDKLAQLLMVGVTGADDARAVAAKYHVGGIFIGGWTDLSMLTDGTVGAIVNAGPLPLAVSVDEEGGRVDRLSSLIGPAPSARSLASTHTPVGDVRLQARQRGQAMRSYGVTIDFAPVVDVSDQADNTVIGDRSFSDDPETVRLYAEAYAQGLRDAGILPVLKHFPGHGHGSGDSHTGAVVTPPLEDLKHNDLLPYRSLLTQFPVAVMVGHMKVPGLTGDQPASLSHEAYGLLRSGVDYGGPPFGGLVFTDDLSSMKAISDTYGVADAVLKALQAGADTALWVTTAEVPEVLDRLQAAVDHGELSMADVDQKVGRMAGSKGRSPRCGR
jgi:beta-N-acetylhexosaminidase